MKNLILQMQLLNFRFSFHILFLVLVSDRVYDWDY